MGSIRDSLEPDATIAETADGVGSPTPEIDESSRATGLAAAEEELKAVLAEEELEEEQELTSPGWDGELPENVFKVVDARIAIWDKLLALDAHRHEFRRSATSEQVLNEIARQTRELQRLPSGESLKSSLERITQQLQSPNAASVSQAKDEDEDEDKVDEDEEEEDTEQEDAEDEVEGDGAVVPDATAPDPALTRLLNVGLAQLKLLIAREHTNALIPKVAAELCADEPLALLCRRHKVDADTLLGWTFYALGLELRIARYRRQENEHRASQAAAADKARRETGALRSIFGGKGGKDDGPALDPSIPRLRQAAEREYKAIERHLANAYWQLYEELAWLLASEPLGGEDGPRVRAFLRYGLVSIHPGVLPPAKLEFVIDDCTRNVVPWQNTVNVIHAVYPDEYVQAVFARQTTPSPDEDLDLNGRGTPQWKADRLWRLSVINRVRAELFLAECERLKGEIARLDQKRAEDEQTLEALRQSSKRNAKRKAEALDKELVGTRSQIGRCSKTLEKLLAKAVPELKQQAAIAESKLPVAQQVLSPEQIIRREARFIRRLARLTARLKEPYPAFVLRDRLEPERSDHHHRAAVQEAVAQLEKADPRIFHQTVVPNKDLDKRSSVRTPATFLIVPARGQMGISINPRRNNDLGRLVLPLMGQRQNMLERMLVDILADFRWDCSMEEAGIDWITADALCSAYATVRWNYRNRGEQIQKKAGFDKKTKDRQNWRVHYRLFVTSAEDRGRKLFNKCLDAYNCIVQYVGMPEGMEPLKRE
ncbi:MAG: hypothetical protein JXB13_10430 [Phycisphaerae bacterium]|nr:hypothetical protein [Phycisphaerae bacterium]